MKKFKEGKRFYFCSLSNTVEYETVFMATSDVVFDKNCVAYPIERCFKNPFSVYQYERYCINRYLRKNNLKLECKGDLGIYKQCKRTLRELGRNTYKERRNSRRTLPNVLTPQEIGEHRKMLRDIGIEPTK